MSYLLLICQLVLALTMLLAATGKILHHEQLLTALRESNFNHGSEFAIAFFTPIIELLLAIGLLLNTDETLSLLFLLSTGLLLLFTAWMLNAYIRGLRIRCGCFGNENTVIGLGTLARNVVLLLLAVGGFQLTHVTESPLPTPSLWLLMSVLAGMVGVMLLYAFYQNRTALILSVAQLKQAQEQIGTQAEEWNHTL